MAIMPCDRPAGEHSSVCGASALDERDGVLSLRLAWEGRKSGAAGLWEVSAVFCQRGMAGCPIKSLTTGMRLSTI